MRLAGTTAGQLGLGLGLRPDHCRPGTVAMYTAGCCTFRRKRTEQKTVTHGRGGEAVSSVWQCRKWSRLSSCFRLARCAVLWLQALQEQLAEERRARQAAEAVEGNTSSRRVGG